MGDAYDDYCDMIDDDYCDMIDAREHGIAMQIVSMAEQGVWITKNGRVLKIKEMGTQHLENTVRMLERSPRGYFKHIELMQKELSHRRGV